jgi:flagellar hook assembly protein FlgD
LRVQPNPFNPRTSVIFAAPGAARLAVYDARGHRLRSVAVADAGQWTWDGTDNSGRAAPSGTYLLRLESAQGVLARQSATLLR